jgi:hypothetical protein
MSQRLTFPNRHNHLTQKVRIGGHRVLYLSIHDDPNPVELFLRVKGPDVTTEIVALYDVIARLLSVSLQYGASLEKMADLLSGAKFRPMRTHLRSRSIKHCTSLLTGRKCQDF